MHRATHKATDWRSLTLLALAAILLTVWQHRADPARGSLPERMIRSWGRPMQAGFTRLAAWPHGMAERASQNAALVAENRRLRQQLAEKSAQVTELFQCYLDNKALREQLGLPLQRSRQRIPARIIRWETTANQARITVMTERPGLVDRRDVVTQAAGLVGLVTRVQGDTAEVMLLLDPDAAAAAVNLRSRDHGIVNPLPGLSLPVDRLKMEKMQVTADPRVGDLIVTSGMDQVYPAGLPLGTIERVQRTPASAERVTAVIRPAVDYTRLEYVWILKPR